MADTPQQSAIRGRLLEAELAYHRLNTGTMVAEATDQNGERVKFSVTNIDKLETYIASLKGQLPEAVDAPVGWPFVASSVGFIF